MIRKLWQYQKERFPLNKHTPLIAVFSFCAVSYSAMLRGEAPGLMASFVAFAGCLISFLHLRLADEFKDHEEDCRYRPYRPVPRGLVSLRQLGCLWVITAILQLGLTLMLATGLIWLLLITWIYLALMSVEFFARDWLKARPVVYLVSHMAIMPLVDLYATACDWIPSGGRASGALVLFLITSYFNGVNIELGRKIRCPELEEHGVETYSRLWGMRKAVAWWILSIGATGIFACLAASRIDFLWPVFGFFAIVFAWALRVGFRFLKAPSAPGQHLIETTSGVVTLIVYGSLGILPLITRIL